MDQPSGFTRVGNPRPTVKFNLQVSRKQVSLMSKQIVDSFGRVHTNLRISVTDRCNIRCFYCMPNENIRFLPRREILSFEEIFRIANVCGQLGVTKLRITGGEPLVRAQLPKLIEMLVAIDGINDVALTTNGILLADQAEALKAAGLHRLNVSLDTLSEATFEKISRRTGLDKVLAGIFKAKEAGFDQIRLNAISIRNLTEDEVIPLANFSRHHGFELRFIEFMPLDAEQNWHDEKVLTGKQLRAIIESEFGPLIPAARTDPSQPAVDFVYSDGKGRMGLISPVSEPFCRSCNRLRLTAEGMIRNCLFSTHEWDARRLLRDNAPDDEIASLILQCVGAKKAAHGIDSDDFSRPLKAMYQIGG